MSTFNIKTHGPRKLDDNDNFVTLLPRKPPKDIVIYDTNRQTKKTRGLIAIPIKGGGWEFYDKYHGYKWSEKRQAYIPFDIK